MKKYIFENKKSLILAIIFAIIEVICVYFVTLKSGQVTQLFYEETFNLSRVVIESLFLLIIVLLANVISEYYLGCFSRDVSSAIRHDYMESLYKNKTSNYLTTSRSEHIARIDTDVDQLRLDYIIKLPTCIIRVGQALVYLTGIFFIHPFICFLTFILSILPSLCGRIFSPRISKAQVSRSLASSSYLERLYELLDGYFVIKQAENTSKFIEDFDKRDYDLLDKKKNLNILNASLYQSMFTLNLLSVLLLIVTGSIFVKKGFLELSALVASISLVSVATNTIGEAMQYLVNIVSTKELSKNILSKISFSSNEQRVKKVPKLDIDVDKLSPYYGDKVVFSDLSMEIEKGKSYAIIGRSGSGKSTFTKLFLKINENYRGDISFANGNLKDFTEGELYQLIYYIPQDPIIFRDTIRNNISMYNEESIESLDNIINLVGLSNLISAKGEEVIDGSSISGGEKKKIEIARALASKADLLIFDEPTANLDPASRKNIEDIIFALEGITKIVITHNQDKSYLDKFDRVINIEDYK